MRHHSCILLIVLSLIIIQTCYLSVVMGAPTASNNSTWSMFRFDSSRSGYSEGGETTNSSKLLWTYTTGKSISTSPVTTEDSVIMSSGDGFVYCLNIANGTLDWRYPAINTTVVYSTPAISGSHLYIGSSDGNLTCIDIKTGAPVWGTNLNGVVWSSPLVLNGLVFVGSNDRNLYCLNASNGVIVYSFPTLGPINSSPAYFDGTIYFSTDNDVYALNATTGKELWHTFAASGSSSPALYNGRLYVGSSDGNISCLNAQTGGIEWKYATQDSVVTAPALAYGYLYVGSEDTNIYCINASTGQKIWQTSTGYWVCSSPIVYAGNVYVGSQDYSLYCLDAFTGSIKWRWETGAAVDSSPVAANGALFFGSDDRNVYALTLYNSSESSLPQNSASSLSLSTIVFDAISVALFAGIIAVFLFLVVSKRRRQQTVDQAKKLPWYRAHIDLLCIIVILSFSAILFANLTSQPLWVTDEQTYSQWSFHMLKTGDYLTPWNYGIVSLWIAKPPLNMWLTSLAFQVFGANNFGARFFSALLGALSLILMYYLGKHLYNRTVGLVSAIVLGTFTMFLTFATRYMTDVPLLFFVLASLYCMLLTEKGNHTLLYSALSGLFFGLALMTKQTEALLIPAIAILYLILSKRSVKFLFSKRFALFFGVALLVITPWLIAMNASFGGDFWGYYFTYSTYERVVNPIEGHFGGYLFYFEWMAGNENLLWLALLPFAVGLSVYQAVKHSKSDLLILTWIAVVFLVFAIAQTKLYYYILPVYPALALAIGSLIYWLSKKAWSFKHTLGHK